MPKINQSVLTNRHNIPHSNPRGIFHTLNSTYPRVIPPINSSPVRTAAAPKQTPARVSPFKTLGAKFQSVQFLLCKLKLQHLLSLNDTTLGASRCFYGIMTFINYFYLSNLKCMLFWLKFWIIVWCYVLSDVYMCLDRFLLDYYGVDLRN